MRNSWSGLQKQNKTKTPDIFTRGSSQLVGKEIHPEAAELFVVAGTRSWIAFRERWFGLASGKKRKTLRRQKRL